MAKLREKKNIHFRDLKILWEYKVLSSCNVFVPGIASYGFPYRAFFCYACGNLGL